MDLLRIATSQGADLERLEKLMDLQQRYEREQARKQFTEAIAAFKADPPRITKNKHVHFATRDGDKVDYWHATHDEVCGKIGAALARHGLSHAWRQRQENGAIFVTCTLTHSGGHKEDFELFGAPDTSGKKSPLQAMASTITFLQRYTLLGACGLSSSELRDADDDARGGAAEEPEPTAELPNGITQTFQSWQADMEAVADEGLQRLTETWGKSPPAFRRYVVKFREEWWNELKGRAPK